MSHRISDKDAVPQGYHSVTPYLAQKNTDQAIRFYEQAFGAKEVGRLSMPDGSIAHAEIEIGNSRIMMSDETPAFGNKSPEAYGGSPAAFSIYVADVDASFAQALAAGATVKRPVQDQFYGDRTGTLLDPFGYQWSIATRKEEVSLDEMRRRMQGAMSSAAS